MSKSENRNYSVTMFSPLDAFFQNGVKADVLFLQPESFPSFLTVS